MPPLRPSSIRLAKAATPASRIAAKEVLVKRTPPSPFPIISVCPSSSCNCTPTPEGLNIDRTTKLTGTMAAYSQHILVFTGQADWKSRIEDEAESGTWGPFLAGLKKAFGRNGKFHDPYKNVLISASSWAPSEPRSQASREKHVEALVFPSFSHKRLSTGEKGSVDKNDLSDFCEEISSSPSATSAHANGALSSQPLEYPTILICSHSSRDTRCGVLGPLLHREFHSVISNTYHDSLALLSDPTRIHTNSYSNADSQQHLLHPASTNIGMISHIGGHKWAGNVIVYIPPKWRIVRTNTVNSEQNGLSPLAGMGIWYGRVEPRHVQGIVEETLLKGNVIKELFRGGIDVRGDVVRIT